MLEGEPLERFYGKLEALGEKKVQEQLSQGVFGDLGNVKSKAVLVKAWLAEKEEKRKATQLQRELELKKQGIEHAKEANTIAQAANSIANEAKDVAKESKDISKSSRNYAVAALVVSSVISIMGILVPNHNSQRALTESREANQLGKEAIEKSKEANVIAKEAQDNAKKLFIKETRPYLNLELKKDESTHSFFVVKEKNSLTSITIKFKLENVGPSPAANITPPKAVCLSGNRPKDGSPFTSVLPPSITLGPGQSRDASFEITFRGNHQKILKEIEQDLFNIQIQVVWFYENLLDSNQKYKSRQVYKVYSNRSNLLASEMD